MKNLILSCLVISSLVVSTEASAQLGTAAPTSAMTVSIAQVRDLAVTSGGTTLFDFNSIAKLDAGIETTNAVGLTYKANKPWILSIKANSATFTGTSPTPMPASVVTYRLNGGGAYTALTTTNVAIAGTGGTRGTASVGIDYKLNPGYIYAPATDYALVITYTISDQ